MASPFLHDDMVISKSLQQQGQLVFYHKCPHCQVCRSSQTIWLKAISNLQIKKRPCPAHPGDRSSPFPSRGRSLSNILSQLPVLSQ